MFRLVLSLKKNQPATENVIISALPAAGPSKKEQRKEVVKTIRKLVQDNGRPHGKNRQHDNSGWQGVPALIFGLVGIAALFAGSWICLLSIPAIVFGAWGMGRGHEHRGMAIAGFAFGVLTVGLLLAAFISVA